MGTLDGTHNVKRVSRPFYTLVSHTRFFFLTQSSLTYCAVQRMDKESEKMLCLQAWDQTSNTMDYKSG